MVKFDFREEWKPSFVVADETYICYNCNTTVCAKFKIKYEYNDGRQRILFCPSCNAPSVFDYQNEQIIKNVDYGNFNKVPENILNLYREICDCISVSANRGAFLLLRTLLAYIAIELDKDKQTGLKEGGNLIFQSLGMIYVLLVMDLAWPWIYYKAI